MSFVITLYVREGIVMASDSRLTLNAQEQQLGNTVTNLAVATFGSNYKTFLAASGVGISTFGAADIQGVPIGGYVETFMRDVLGNATLPVQQVAQQLLDHFRQITPTPATQCHVAGYTKTSSTADQEVWAVVVPANEIIRLNPPGQQGAAWGGESDILARLIQPVAVIDQAGAIQTKLPSFPVPWQFFTLQDAIDFAIFAVRSTSDAIRFQPRPKTVGGPIDVLVIKPSGAEWIQRKQLHGE